MDIAGLIKSTLVDYPDHVACVLFVGGCNFNCFYCHNRQLLDGTQPNKDDGEIWEFLQKRKNQLDGVVITGGEPTIWPDLLSFIQRIKDMGYKVKLDTNGSRPGIVAQLISEELVDYVAVDYKAPLFKYEGICGEYADAQAVLQTVDVLTKSGIDFEVRTTVIPQLTKADLMLMAQELPVVPRYVLNRYRPPEHYLPRDEQRIKKKPYTIQQIEALAQFIRTIQPNVRT